LSSAPPRDLVGLVRRSPCACPFQVDHNLYRCSWQSSLTCLASAGSANLTWVMHVPPCVGLQVAVVVVVLPPLVADGEGWRRWQVPVRPHSPTLTRHIPCDCFAWLVDLAFACVQLPLGWNFSNEIVTLSGLLPFGMVTPQRFLHCCCDGLLSLPAIATVLWSRWHNIPIVPIPLPLLLRAIWTMRLQCYICPSCIAIGKL
jgi:hypothetical protein